MLEAGSSGNWSEVASIYNGVGARWKAAFEETSNERQR